MCAYTNKQKFLFEQQQKSPSVRRDSIAVWFFTGKTIKTTAATTARQTKRDKASKLENISRACILGFNGKVNDEKYRYGILPGRMMAKAIAIEYTQPGTGLNSWPSNHITATAQWQLIHSGRQCVRENVQPTYTQRLCASDLLFVLCLEHVAASRQHGWNKNEQQQKPLEFHWNSRES